METREYHIERGAYVHNNAQIILLKKRVGYNVLDTIAYTYSVNLVFDFPGLNLISSEPILNQGPTGAFLPNVINRSSASPFCLCMNHPVVIEYIHLWRSIHSTWLSGQMAIQFFPSLFLIARMSHFAVICHTLHRRAIL